MLVVVKEGWEYMVVYDEVIVVVGWKVRLKGFGLEEIGIIFDKIIDIDEYL